jgi:magnesium-transporting ATPase (P-type)
LAAVDDALTEFSVNGLRTLMMAWKQFKTGEYESFSRRYDRAECALRNRDRKVARVCELVETDFRLLGCSAIEDKLQDQVPETIHYLLQASIYIHMHILYRAITTTTTTNNNNNNNANTCF